MVLQGASQPSGTVQPSIYYVSLLQCIYLLFFRLLLQVQHPNEPVPTPLFHLPSQVKQSSEPVPSICHHRLNSIVSQCQLHPSEPIPHPHFFNLFSVVTNIPLGLFYYPIQYMDLHRTSIHIYYMHLLLMNMRSEKEIHFFDGSEKTK